MIGFVVNRVIFESTLIPPEGTNNMETYTTKALTINNDMESFLLRSIIPSVILYGDSFKDQEDHDLSKHVKSIIAKKLKTCSSESITLFTEKYLTTYLKMISYHITQYIWSNYKGLKYLSIEYIMRTLNMGAEEYLIKNKYIRSDGNPKGLSKGIFKIANALLELLHPKKLKASKKSDDEDEEEQEEKKKPKKPIKLDEEKKPKKSDEEEKKSKKTIEKTIEKKKSEEPEEKKKKEPEEKKKKEPEEKKKPKKSDEEDKKKNNPTKSTAKKSNKKPKSDEDDDHDDKNEEFHSVNDDELEYAN
jgi:chemotaxis protein histidine kinase CheA